MTGSALLGTVFPGWGPDGSSQIWAPPSGDDRWSAVLRLTGNPIKVFNRYLGEARELGFDSRARCQVVRRHVGETGNYSAVAIEGTDTDASYLHLSFCPTT